MNGLDNPRPAVTPVKSGFHLDRSNAKVFGVCSGIARHFDIDPMIVRVAFAAGTILGFGSLLLVYLAIALIAD
ncbi:PspC domain protein [Tsuneonella dongtanensis]|uniref:PspC domain protein n=1 Tax=Tsuneonella dongtanensis TaxID=692370 RepID=A0A1B2ADS9_9SPHN|nr:PspC domain-containing protein [Tsuneonella dongtanensis]ANY20261.1 PspC domain protein [Tsuneonella dongtanensis]